MKVEKMKDFLELTQPDEIYKVLKQFKIPVKAETVKIENAIQRVCAVNYTAKESIPPFCRSIMDGYAVNSKDISGASEQMPVYLTLTGEVIMGEKTDFQINEDETAVIHTGGMLPKGADSVVMLEYCRQLDKKTIEICKKTACGENIIKQGDDVKSGSEIIKKGTRLRVQDIGILAALGYENVQVFKNPVISIISTGDELVDISQTPKPGQIRDINSWALYAQVKESFGIPLISGIVSDNDSSLKSAVTKALTSADIVLISGGSSVGTRDVTSTVLNNLGPPGVLVHGINVKPGKPTIIADINGKPVIGMPGHPVSSIVICAVYVSYLIKHISGEQFNWKTWHKPVIKAKMGSNIVSAIGKREYLRVNLINEDNHQTAYPVMGQSAAISTLVKAQGLILCDNGVEGYDTGDEIEVMLF